VLPRHPLPTRPRVWRSTSHARFTIGASRATAFYSACCWRIDSFVQAAEALKQPAHIILRELAVREQDAVADRGDQDVDRFFDRKSRLATLESAAVEGLQVMGRVGATARGGGF
jgi:hypothetical protein